MPRPGRAWKVVAVVGGGLVVMAAAGALAFGPVVRARIAKEAERRHLEIEVGRIRPGVFAVRLEDVRLRPTGVAGVAVQLDEVRVELSPSLAPREVQSRGGRLEVEGEPHEVLKRLDEYRHRTTAAGASPPSGAARVPISAEGLAVSWKTPSGATFTGEGLRVARSEDGLRFGAASLAARQEHLALEMKGLEIDVEPSGGPRRVFATTLDISLAPVATSNRASPPPRAPSADPTPPPLPPVTARKPGKPGKVQAVKAAVDPRAGGTDEASSPGEPLLPLPDLSGVRGRIAVVAAEVERRVPEGLRVDVGGLSVHLDAAGEPLAFGPGPFSLERRGGAVHVVFTSGAKDAPAKGGAAPGTPLSIDLDLPLGAGDVVARLAGGPVSLAVLGVKEGMRGLTDVGRGTVSGKGKLALAADGSAVTFDGEVAVRGVSWNQPRLAPEPMKDLSFQSAARGVLESTGKVRIDEAQLDMGALHLRAHGTVEETPDHFALSLGVDVAPAGCQALLESAPRGLMPIVQEMHMSGTFGASAQVAFDTRTIDKMLLDYRIDDRCRMVEGPREIARERFAKSFTYRTYHPDGTLGETTTGPGTTSWTDLDAISPFMVAAVLTTEDGAFYKHHGFNHAAIRGSVLANLKARKFVRGASTITMQLAKNLFLSRSKVLSRKLEEVVLTDYLEQAFQKDEMMELYLNVVEFGPDVYGITHAAAHYFGRKPEELNVAECFFLATLLPSPVRFGKLRDKGQVSEGWLKHLRTLMEIAAKNGKISRAELAEALEQNVTFVRPGDPRPEPRKAAATKRRDPIEDDAGWAPLD